MLQNAAAVKLQHLRCDLACPIPEFWAQFRVNILRIAVKLDKAEVKPLSRGTNRGKIRRSKGIMKYLCCN